MLIKIGRTYKTYKNKEINQTFQVESKSSENLKKGEADKEERNCKLRSRENINRHQRNVQEIDTVKTKLLKGKILSKKKLIRKKVE